MKNLTKLMIPLITVWVIVVVYLMVSMQIVAFYATNAGFFVGYWLLFKLLYTNKSIKLWLDS